ncbi:hypothetical protein BDV39DRAFT_179077 [Aspergillus sergii]|uniref:Uncharacterized protein n=1 Tax=Aspergillus sergii TaxID=1034303 RepID=A0A5N6WWB4_9EURO|nr:hypothetical protein BDV39DRAFT_179077 [Aspergillus sergii]
MNEGWYVTGLTLTTVNEVDTSRSNSISFLRVSVPQCSGNLGELLTIYDLCTDKCSTSELIRPYQCEITLHKGLYASVARDQNLESPSIYSVLLRYVWVRYRLRSLTCTSVTVLNSCIFKTQIPTICSNPEVEILRRPCRLSIYYLGYCLRSDTVGPWLAT